MDHIALLLTNWSRRGVLLRPPASNLEVATAEQQLACSLPAAVRSLYSEVNGTFPPSDFVLRLWALEEVVAYAQQSAPKDNFVAFMDIAACAPSISFKKSHGDRALYSFGRAISRDLDEFISKYLNDPSALGIEEIS